MKGRGFIDTNILNYAHDLGAGAKHERVVTTVRGGWELRRYQLSFWDSMIVAAAAHGDSERILTEDLNHGQVIEGVKIESPFHNNHQGEAA